MLIVWGTNDPFFTIEGAKAYQRDIPNAELHLINTGHFALETHVVEIAATMKHFVGANDVGRHDVGRRTMPINIIRLLQEKRT